MILRDHVPSEHFVGQRVNLMLDRAPAWPHLGLGDGQISAISEKKIRIEGILNELGLSGSIVYEIAEAHPGAASVRLKIDSNRFNMDCTKIVSTVEIGAQKILFYDNDSYRLLALLDYAKGSLAPRGIEVFCPELSEGNDNYRMHFDYS